MNNLLLLLILVMMLPVSASSDQVIPMSQHKSGTFYVDVIVADQPRQKFVVDTGASHVTISHRTLKKLLNKKQALFVRSMKGILADGSNIDVPVYKVTSLEIAGVCRFNDVEVAVIKSDTRSVLGLSVLSRAAPFVFNLSPPQLKLSNCPG